MNTVAADSNAIFFTLHVLLLAVLIVLFILLVIKMKAINRRLDQFLGETEAFLNDQVTAPPRK